MNVISNSYGQNINVLFIGNSYTYVNNLPQTVADIATSMGDTMTFDSSTPGGYTLNLHSTNITTLTKINSQPWDFVVLQEQSQLPSFDPSQVNTDVFPYARKLDSLILVNDSCTETFFYMTWGRQNGDASNCASYPPVCTYNGMQQRLRDSYVQMAIDNHASVSPVGVAWKRFRDTYPAISLYQPDESHPSVHGTYLAACVFYSSLFHKSSVGSSFITPGISASDAYSMQLIASSVVLDSMSTWQGNGDVPLASYNSIPSGSTLQFVNTSINSLNYYWNFGDGNFSTNINPMNTYTLDGEYVVTLIASNDCFSYSVSDTISVNSTSITDADKSRIILFPNPVRNEFEINFKDEKFEKINLMIYNSVGQLVFSKYYHDGSKIQEKILYPSGLYFISIWSDSRLILTQKVTVEQ